jgi:hypothetical protein
VSYAPNAHVLPLYYTSLISQLRALSPTPLAATCHMRALHFIVMIPGFFLYFLGSRASPGSLVFVHTCCSPTTSPSKHNPPMALLLATSSCCSQFTRRTAFSAFFIPHLTFKRTLSLNALRIVHSLPHLSFFSHSNLFVSNPSPESCCFFFARGFPVIPRAHVLTCPYAGGAHARVRSRRSVSGFFCEARAHPDGAAHFRVPRDT